MDYKNKVKKILEQRTFWQAALAVLLLALCIFFFKHEHLELRAIRQSLQQNNPFYIFLGFIFTGVYILLQAYMYVKSFQTVQQPIPFKVALSLFLKRNLVSVFLPAGGFSSLAFFTKAVEKQGVSRTNIYYASYIYAFCGLLTVVVLAVPALLFLLLKDSLQTQLIFAFLGTVALVLALGWLAVSVIRRGKMYQLLQHFAPAIASQLTDLQAQPLHRPAFWGTIQVSLFIEVVGIAHIYIAMLAMGLPASLEAALIGYIVMVIFLIVSPFLRGMGAIEISMTFIFTQYGYPTAAAAGITLLFRLFEFWLPLVAGVVSFFTNRNNLLYRLLPAIIILSLGLINIVSAITPSIPARLRLLQSILPADVISISNFLVLVFGLVLLILSVYLLKGLRTAWWTTVILTALSIAGHLLKAADYEEALIAATALFALIITRRAYFVKSDPRSQRAALKNIGIAVTAVFIYGIIGFFFLDKIHFGLDFDFKAAAVTLLRLLFLLDSDYVIPRTPFGSAFFYSIYLAGGGILLYTIYTIGRPFIFQTQTQPEEKERAEALVKQYGNSALDYFKTYFDKLYFFAPDGQGFLAYRTHKNFAVVLENPVCPSPAHFQEIIRHFDAFCHQSSLKAIYYRVPEESLPLYEKLGKKHLLIGQEAIVNLETFSLSGGKMKSLRNAIKKVESLGYFSKVYLPPQRAGLLQKLEQVSDQWLKTNERSEIVFSQGIFRADLVKTDIVITVENADEKVVAFVNIVPDFAPGEATYDLIRKTDDAPNGTMDFVLIRAFEYLKEQQYRSVNLGLAPMAGMENAGNITEKALKYAYHNIKRFAPYRGLREYKDKFQPYWVNKYLIYTDNYDLLQIPGAISKVMEC